MAELSLRERLQPTLLDRLVDDERLLTVYEFSCSRAELTRLGLDERNLAAILTAQHLRRSGEGIDGHRQGSPIDTLVWRFVAPSGRVSLGHLKALVLKPPGAPEGIALQSFCRIEARNVLNDTAESVERRYVSMRRLREYVYRDLALLLNSLSLEVSVDLGRYPQVQRSVLNYGMRSLAGVAAVSIDPAKIAADIETAIKRFEPRLKSVRVSLEPERAAGDGHHISFRVEADLWCQPVPQHLVLRTRIDTETGGIGVVDSGAK
jgi:type VI secretion system protein ImpF